MTSADFSSFVVTASFRSPTRPPRVRATAFIPCTCHIYIHDVLSRYWVCSHAPARPIVHALICGFYVVRSELCLHLPSDSVSPRTPLVLASDSHDWGSQRTFTSKLLPMPGTPAIAARYAGAGGGYRVCRPRYAAAPPLSP